MDPRLRGDTTMVRRRSDVAGPLIAAAALAVATFAILAALLTSPAGPARPSAHGQIDRHESPSTVPPIQSRALARATGVTSLLGLGALLLAGRRSRRPVVRPGLRIFAFAPIATDPLRATGIDARGPPVPSLV